jgi:hypothetical protein
MVRLEHRPVQGIDTAYRLDLGGLTEETTRDCPAPNRVIRKKMLNQAFEHYGAEWMGGLHNWKEAAAVLEKGWPEGGGEAAGADREALSPAPAGEVDSPQTDVGGRGR